MRRAEASPMRPRPAGSPAPTAGVTLPSPVCALLLTMLGFTVVVAAAEGAGQCQGDGVRQRQVEGTG